MPSRLSPRLIALALSLAAVAATPAGASKEKFERTKPHVNIGTMGLMNESLSLTVGLVDPRADAGLSSEPAECSATVSVRILDANEPGAAPLLQSDGIELRTGRTHVFVWDTRGGAGGAGPTVVRHVVLVEDADGVDGRDCVLRGHVEARGLLDSRTTKHVPLRVEDFVALPSGRFFPFP